MFHQPFYPQPPPPPPTFHNSRGPNNFFIPAHSYYNRPDSVSNRSSLNLNFTRDFEHFSMPQYGYPSAPSGAYSFYDVSNQNYDQQRWRFNMPRSQQQHRIPPFYFQDKSTFYYMSEPIVTNDDRITIQLTKVYIGPNGDQQRVFVEQEFSNENELNNFVRNLRHNFKKTFNNRATGVHSSTDDSQSSNGKKAGVIVVEEPDEEPKIYPQEVYNENIQSKFEDRDQSQRSPRISSCSTVRSKKHQRNKMKYRRQKVDNQINKEEEEGQKVNGKASRLFQTPSYSRHYEPPPRFQQRFFNKENESRMRTDFSVPPNPNNHWRYNQGLNGYPHPLNNRSRSYVPPMSENIPPPPTTPSRFHYGKDPFFRPIHPPTPPRFTRARDQSPSRFRRSQPPPQQQQQQQYPRNNQQSRPRTIAENLTFTNNKQQQPPVHRTRSDCRQNLATRSQSKSHEYLDYGPNLNYSPTQQRHFIPGIPPPSRSIAPLAYPQRRLFQNTQVQLRLFNPCHLGPKRF